KDDLLAEAAKAGIDESIQYMLSIAALAPEGKKHEALIDAYLSKEHRDAPEAGCLIAALGAEASRQTPQFRRTFQEELRKHSRILGAFMPAKNPRVAARQSGALFSGMAGAMMVARILGPTPECDQFLEQARVLFKNSLRSEA